MPDRRRSVKTKWATDRGNTKASCDHILGGYARLSRTRPRNRVSLHVHQVDEGFEKPSFEQAAIEMPRSDFPMLRSQSLLTALQQ